MFCPEKKFSRDSGSIMLIRTSWSELFGPDCSPPGMSPALGVEMIPHLSTWTGHDDLKLSYIQGVSQKSSDRKNANFKAKC